MSICYCCHQPDHLNRGRFGRYTNFVNLLDCAAIAIPAGFDSQDHLPAGVILIAPAFTDDALAPLADALHCPGTRGMGHDKTADLPQASKMTTATDDTLSLVVVDAYLSGMPLNHELTAPDGKLLKQCHTAADYRLFALPTPPRPSYVWRANPAMLVPTLRARSRPCQPLPLTSSWYGFRPHWASARSGWTTAARLPAFCAKRMPLPAPRRSPRMAVGATMSKRAPEHKNALCNMRKIVNQTTRWRLALTFFLT